MLRGQKFIHRSLEAPVLVLLGLTVDITVPMFHSLCKRVEP